MKPKSIVLLSGGLDSTVSAAVAKRKTRILFALTFDYGQRAARMEIRAVKKICKILRMKHKIVELPFFKEFRKCSLIALSRLPVTARVSSLWVPNRNGLFINIAACFAEYYGAALIVTGFNAEEAQEFPDNTAGFVRSMNKTLACGTLKKVRVKSYVANLNKNEIYRLGLRYKAPLENIYSCYLGGKKMCGRCASCLRLFRAKKSATTIIR